MERINAKQIDLSSEKKERRILFEKIAMAGWLTVWILGFIMIAFVNTIWGMAACSGSILRFLFYYLAWRKDTGRI